MTAQTPESRPLDDARDALKSIRDTAELIFGEDAPPVSFMQLKAFAAAMGADARRGLDAVAAREPEPVPLPAGIAVAALECIRQAYETGTMAHDTAHKALDDYFAATREPQPELAAAMAVLRRVLEWFTINGTHVTADVTRAQYAAAFIDGGLIVPENLRPFLGKPKRESK